MSDDNYTDEQILTKLCSFAPIESFYVNQCDYIIGSGLVCYFSEEGLAFILSSRTDRLNDACVDYLVRHNAPVFTNVELMEQYKEEWKQALQNEET